MDMGILSAVHDTNIAEALAVANRFLRNEELDQADAIYRAILAVNAAYPDALHFLGVLRHMQGRSDESIALMRQALVFEPDAAGMWNNLGNVLLENGQIDEATSAYERSATLAPDEPQAHNNLATIYRRQRHWELAEASCRRALAAEPDMADAWYNLSLILLAQGKVAEGLKANSHATLLWPRHLLAREQVLRALVLLGELDQAAELYREWLAEDPDNPVVQHQLAACLQGAEAPARASDAYVETLFDHFAGSFDAKLANLHYCAPELVAGVVRRLLGEPQADGGALSVVDLGCGTGLCGPLIRPWAARLAGCDLSVGMLRQAKARRVYDVLHKAELVYYLDTQPGAFDLLICADTLCYFGELQPVMHAAQRALRPGGHFVFTVEALTAQERGSEADSPGSQTANHRLQPNGRFAHGSAYVQQVVLAAGLSLIDLAAVELRQEAGQPVRGWLATVGKPR